MTPQCKTCPATSTVRHVVEGQEYFALHCAHHLSPLCGKEVIPDLEGFACTLHPDAPKVVTVTKIINEDDGTWGTTEAHTEIRGASDE